MSVHHQSNRYKPKCEGVHCLHPHSEVRLLPYCEDGHIVVCHNCYLREMEYRRDRRGAGVAFSLIDWSDLRVYRG